MIDPAQLQQAVAAARPGTILEFTLRIIVPGGEKSGEGQIIQQSVMERGVVLAPESECEAARDTDPVHRTPLQRLRALLSVQGDRHRKESDWAAAICSSQDLPARELERACRAGAIAWTLKQDGRDAGARLILGRELEGYLRLREAVRKGEEYPPPWWEEVVSKRQRKMAA